MVPTDTNSYILSMAGKEKSAKKTQDTQIIQNISTHYIKKTSLKALLKELFPQHVEFHIRVRLFCTAFSPDGPLIRGVIVADESRRMDLFCAQKSN